MFGLVGILETKENEEPKGIVRKYKMLLPPTSFQSDRMVQLIKTCTDSQLISYSQLLGHVLYKPTR